MDTVAKAYKSSILGIEEHRFNTGQNKFTAQFTQSRENVANFLQRTAHDEGYLVAETVRTGKQQMIDLPPPIDGNDPNAEDLKIVRAEELKSVAKRRLKLEESLRRDTRQCTVNVLRRCGINLSPAMTGRESKRHNPSTKDMCGIRRPQTGGF
jgi:hypothetical protein